MRQGVEITEQSRNTEDPYELRLMSLLQDLVKEKGRRGAARALGVDHRTVAASMEEGRLSKRVRGALEFALLTGADPEAARQRERVKALEERMVSLEERAEAGHAELRRVVEDGIAGLREDYSQAMRLIEKRLAALESSQEGPGTSKETAKVTEKPIAKPAWRQYRDLVTLEPEPREGQIYGDATPLIVEWRQVMTEFRGAKTKLRKVVAEERLLELEIEMIDKHGLTLPHRTYPWNSSERRNEVRRKQQVLEEVRVDRARAQLRLWLRRVFTLGLWRN